MIIVRYSTNDGIDQVNEMYQTFQKFGFKEEVIFLPQDWDILFNCSVIDLQYYKRMIEGAIYRKEKQLDEKIKSVLKGMSNESKTEE